VWSTSNNLVAIFKEKEEFTTEFHRVTRSNKERKYKNSPRSFTELHGAIKKEKEEFTTEFHRVTRSNKERKYKNSPRSFTKLHGAIKKEKEEFTTENTEEHGVFI
jgi:hypothetical protein